MVRWVGWVLVAACCAAQALVAIGQPWAALTLLLLLQEMPEHTAYQEMTELHFAVIDYYKRSEELPKSLEALTQEHWANPEPLGAVPNDPWGTPYDYTTAGASYRLRSFGRDGQPDTEDDIWRHGNPDLRR